MADREYCPFNLGPQGQHNYYECSTECGSYNRCHGIIIKEIIRPESDIHQQ